MVLENRSYFYLHFTNVETEAQRLSHTPKVTQLASDGAEFTPRPSALTVLTVTRKTQSLPSWSFHLMGNTKGKPFILRWWFNHSFNDVKEKFQAGWKQVLGYLILTGNRRDVQEGFFYLEGERKLAWNSKGWAGVHQVNWEMSLPDGKKDDETLRQITAGSVQGTIRSQYGRVPRWGVLVPDGVKEVTRSAPPLSQLNCCGGRGTSCCHCLYFADWHTEWKIEKRLESHQAQGLFVTHPGPWHKTLAVFPCCFLSGFPQAVPK